MATDRQRELSDLITLRNDLEMQLEQANEDIERLESEEEGDTFYD